MADELEALRAEYNLLLTRHAQAENTIDALRIGGVDLPLRRARAARSDAACQAGPAAERAAERAAGLLHTAGLGEWLQRDDGQQHESNAAADEKSVLVLESPVTTIDSNRQYRVYLPDLALTQLSNGNNDVESCKINDNVAGIQSRHKIEGVEGNCQASHSDSSGDVMRHSLLESPSPPGSGSSLEFEGFIDKSRSINEKSRDEHINRATTSPTADIHGRFAREIKNLRNEVRDLKIEISHLKTRSGSCLRQHACSSSQYAAVAAAEPSTLLQVIDSASSPQRPAFTCSAPSARRSRRGDSACSLDSLLQRSLMEAARLERASRRMKTALRYEVSTHQFTAAPAATTST